MSSQPVSGYDYVRNTVHVRKVTVQNEYMILFSAHVVSVQCTHPFTGCEAVARGWHLPPARLSLPDIPLS